MIELRPVVFYPGQKQNAVETFLSCETLEVNDVAHLAEPYLGHADWMVVGRDATQLFLMPAALVQADRCVA